MSHRATGSIYKTHAASFAKLLIRKTTPGNVTDVINGSPTPRANRFRMPSRDDAKSLFKNNWRLISSVVTPIVLLPVWLVPATDPAKCAYVICLMGVFW